MEYEIYDVKTNMEYEFVFMMWMRTNMEYEFVFMMWMRTNMYEFVFMMWMRTNMEYEFVFMMWMRTNMEYEFVFMMWMRTYMEYEFVFMMWMRTNMEYEFVFMMWMRTNMEYEFVFMMWMRTNMEYEFAHVNLRTCSHVLSIIPDAEEPKNFTIHLQELLQFIEVRCCLCHFQRLFFFSCFHVWIARIRLRWIQFYPFTLQELLQTHTKYSGANFQLGKQKNPFFTLCYWGSLQGFNNTQ